MLVIEFCRELQINYLIVYVQDAAEIAVIIYLIRLVIQIFGRRCNTSNLPLCRMIAHAACHASTRLRRNKCEL